MVVLNLRRLREDATRYEIVSAVNQLVDLNLGNAGGKIRLRGDDGVKKNIAGGATLSSSNYALDVQSTIDNIAAFVLKGTSATAAPSTSNSVVLIQESGLSVASGKLLRIYATAGTNFGSLVSDANGGLTLAGTGASAGTLSLTSITGLATLSLTTSLSIGATPAVAGAIRLTNNTTISMRNAGNSADIVIAKVDGSNNLTLGDLGVANASISAATSSSLIIGASTRIQVNTTGIGFYGVAPVARPTAMTQTYAAVNRTLAAYTPDIENVVYTGLATGLGGTPYASVVDLNALRVAVENLRTHHESLAQHHNAVVDDLQLLGLEQ